MLAGKQERVMAELAGPLRVMKLAIQTARIAYPDYERESGTKWPDKHLDPAEALGAPRRFIRPRKPALVARRIRLTARGQA
jgi:hypothetical protein